MTIFVRCSAFVLLDIVSIKGQLVESYGDHVRGSGGSELAHNKVRSIKSHPNEVLNFTVAVIDS